MGKIGRYQLKAEIGRGGMGTVYRALDPNFNREVAIKVLPREMIHDPTFLSRFRKELAVISSLEHSAIVPVYDGGEESGQPYFVMRYMPGGSLKEWLRSGPLSLQDTARIIERISLGLAYAHHRGIIHRDIKPDNVLFDANSEPYLSDFGVAKLAETSPSSTGSGIIGTPGYLSPEQAQGENNKVDHRSDIYALGVMTYQMLTGEQPYKADTPMGVLVKHVHEPVPNILECNPNLPASLETILKTALAKNREDRYSSVLEFARALSVAAFGQERTMPAELALERRKAASRTGKSIRWISVGILGMALLAGIYFVLPLIAPPPASTPTNTATARSTTAVPTRTQVPPTEPPTATAQMVLQIPEPTPTLSPTPVGGAYGIALISGSGVEVRKTALDGSSSGMLDAQSFEKLNLQWLQNGKLIYIRPGDNCVYEAGKTSTVICFSEEEAGKLTGFRVSPDGSLVAISLNNTLYIVPYEEIFKEPPRKVPVPKGGLGSLDKACRYSRSIKDVRWSRDGSRLAALVVETTRQNAEQIIIFNPDFENCKLESSNDRSTSAKFPMELFEFDTAKRLKIPSYDWDGENLFLLNDSVEGVYGYLYRYDKSGRQENGKVAPKGLQSCCYADARWSPDGKYILFLYKERGKGHSAIQLYYLPTEFLQLVNGQNSVEQPLTPPVPAPLNLPLGSLDDIKHTYPVFEPAQQTLLPGD